MNPLVSVIIPVFNVERYLPQCFASVAAQTFADFELILVDDGSTDDSGGLCDAFAAKDARTRVIHVPNGGVSRARNLGIEASRGEFICFIDSDDWVDAEYLAVLVELVRDGKAQLGVCGMVCEYPGRSEAVIPKEGEFTIASSCAQEVLALCQAPLVYAPYNKIYDGKAMRANGCRFEEDLSYGEDLLFNLCVMTAGMPVGVSSRALYRYRCGEGPSLSGKYREDKFEIDTRVFDGLKSFFETRALLTDAARRYLADRYFWLLYDNLFLAFDPRATGSWLDKYRRARMILGDRRMPTWPDDANPARCPCWLYGVIRWRLARLFTLYAFLKSGVKVACA